MDKLPMQVRLGIAAVIILGIVGLIAWSNAIRNDTKGLEPKKTAIKKDYDSLGAVYTTISKTDLKKVTSCEKTLVAGKLGDRASSVPYADLAFLKTFIDTDITVPTDSWKFLNDSSFMGLTKMSDITYNVAADVVITNLNFIKKTNYFFVLVSTDKELPTSNKAKKEYNGGYVNGYIVLADVSNPSKLVCAKPLYFRNSASMTFQSTSSDTQRVNLLLKDLEKKYKETIETMYK